MKWEIIKRYSRRAGKEVMALAEASFLTMKDPHVSLKHKSMILGSLVYFLSPVDAIPDFLPGGFADDLSVLLTAVLATGKIGKHHLTECRIKHGIVDEDKRIDDGHNQTPKKKS